jgi:hypothetical protein
VIALQEQAKTLVIGHLEPVQFEAVSQLAASSGCSAYNCAFVAVAQQLMHRCSDPQPSQSGTFAALLGKAEVDGREFLVRL